ncbi:REP-associated tyrosine transposase [Pseudomonas cichorii]|uniref:REP-associated tyrosine transposase n=1 Tax=Pseudomonas cichorii TaxID=36746 RepID=UPI00190FCABD|nr:transposase [Pseudomonas cichorii]
MSGVNHGADLRKGRYSETGRIYLLTSVVHERRQIFDDWRAGRLLVDEFRKAQQEGRAHSLAWVVMPDHFHWLVELQSGSLGLLMRRVKSGSSRAVMAAVGADSQVWQKGYHDRAVRREEDLRSIARYIVANPLRAGLVNRVGDYPLWDAVWL